MRFLCFSSDRSRAISYTNQGLLKFWDFSPLPEGRICAVARSCRISAALGARALTLLPGFAQNDLREIGRLLRQRSAMPLDDQTVLAHSLNIYNARRALPAIRAFLQRAAAEPIFLAESIRRIAFLQPPIRDLIYHNLSQIKWDNGTLLQRIPETSAMRALLFECGSTPEERIEAITQTLKHFERMLAGPERLKDHTLRSMVDE
jgi:hypothetical protein